MADDSKKPEKKKEAKDSRTEKISDPKKLEEFKDTPENKEAIAREEEKKTPKKEKQESKPAVANKPKEEPKKEAKVELEREYVIPIRKKSLTVPQYRRAKKAIQIVKTFLAKHMRVEDRDLRKVKVNIHLNNEIWFRGIKKPAHKIKVKAIKKEGVVYAELAEVPEVVKYKIAREEKRKTIAEAAKQAKPKASHTHDHDHDHSHEHNKPEEEKTESEKKDTKEKEKASAEAGKAKQKADAKAAKHTATGKHQKTTAPVRKSLKK